MPDQEFTRMHCREDGKGDEEREKHVEKLRQTLFEDGPQRCCGWLTNVGSLLHLLLFLVQQLVVPVKSL
jgi:hypothetical protein